MESLDYNKFALVFFASFGIATIRYLIFAGIAFSLFWVLWKKKLQHKWIQQDRVRDNSKIRHEIKYSLLTMIVFGFTGILVFTMKSLGWTMIYKDISEYGLPYFFVSLIALILFHDTYFYWTHRMMHHPKLFKKMHLTHHISTNPSPWAAFAFNPYEAVVEAGIVPIAVLLFPLHGLTILFFLLYMTFLNVLGHLAFELFPKNFLRNPIFKWHNTSTHHNMHHRYFHCNYGLYFNWWDRWMNTNHVKYQSTFEEVASRQKV
ncbi:MAG: sterol desaturase family protein [Leptospira sp.]|jgi:Delta7-sterol 5-desaturase|nr:sterol desaturase family protein [Leptospira sp.]NCS93377.1 sterol desaturase family protein [Leptospira sp.]